MVRRLEFAPRSPFHDIDGFVDRIRSAHPGISDQGVSQAVKRALTGFKPRHPSRVVHLYGADILTADLTQLPAWPHITDGEKRRIQQYPIAGGEVIPTDVDAVARRMVQEDLAGRINAARINRSVLISPPGLRQTYVWRASNGWVQEVQDADYDLILSTPANRRLFRDPDIHGPYVPVRSYDAQGEVIATARNLREAEYTLRHLERRPSWQGADVAD